MPHTMSEPAPNPPPPSIWCCVRWCVRWWNSFLRKPDQHNLYQFLLSRTTKDTSDKLISYERCPPGLKPDHFKNLRANFKKEYQRLQKSRHKSEESDHEFVSFTQSLFVYPQTNCKTYMKRAGAEKNHASDEDTFAKVAWELGGGAEREKKRKSRKWRFGTRGW